MKKNIKIIYSIVSEKLMFYCFTYSNYYYLVQDAQKGTIYNYFEYLECSNALECPSAPVP